MAEENEKWKKEMAAGGVVYKKHDDSFFVLLVQPKGRDFGPTQGYWTWPKGLLDKEGEGKEEVAVREVQEEGGVSAKIIEPLGYVKFFQGFRKVIKFIDFYLMEYVDGDPKDHDREMADASWFRLDEVLSKIKFPHDKEIFERAKKALEKYAA